MPDFMMDLLGSMLPASEYATKEYVQARIAEAMNTAGSGPSVVLEPAAFTANGSYQPDPGKAWDDVTVNVSASPWTLVADYTSTQAASVVTATIPSAYQNLDFYKVEIDIEFLQNEYPYLLFNGEYVPYESGGRTAHSPYKYSGGIVTCQRINNGVTEISRRLFSISALENARPYSEGVQSIGLKGYYTDAIKAGCNIKVWGLVES